MDEDGSSGFPCSWYVTRFKTVAVELGQDLTFGVEKT